MSLLRHAVLAAHHHRASEAEDEEQASVPLDSPEVPDIQILQQHEHAENQHQYPAHPTALSTTHHMKHPLVDMLS